MAAGGTKMLSFSNLCYRCTQLRLIIRVGVSVDVFPRSNSWTVWDIIVKFLWKQHTVSSEARTNLNTATYRSTAACGKQFKVFITSSNKVHPSMSRHSSYLLSLFMIIVEASVYGSYPSAAVDALSVKISDCTDDVANWTKSNRLQLNPDKTEAMWCSTSRRRHHLSITAIILAQCVHNVHRCRPDDADLKHWQRSTAILFVVCGYSEQYRGASLPYDRSVN